MLGINRPTHVFRSISWLSVFCWTVGATLLLLAHDWLFEVHLGYFFLFNLLWLLAGVALLLALLVHGRVKAMLGLLAAALILATLPLPGWGGRIWFWISFKQHEAVYDRIVAAAPRLSGRGRVNGVFYDIERGPPLRVAFPQPVGVADNWGAVIHDPSGAVATAKGWGSRAGDFTVRPDLQELWGGDLLTCSRIKGAYYRCWFT